LQVVFAMGAKMRYLLSALGILAVLPAFAEDMSLSSAIADARANCGGISDELNHMKTMAGISTAVTGVGTAVGAGALATGIVKVKRDMEVESYDAAIAALEAMKNGDAEVDFVDVGDRAVFEREIRKFMEMEASILAQPDVTIDGRMRMLEQKRSETEQKSKNLGNARTGLMAGSAATNIAGAAIAGGNKVRGDLKNQIDKCRQSVKDLSRAKQQARIDGSADKMENSIADKIISQCGKWDSVDAGKINSKASGAMVSGIIGAGTGVAGIITSASANSGGVRNDDAESGKKKENNLNNASNILAGASTGASLVAAIFNAAQISAIKKASEVADGCEEVLK
jgi:hypothetical protein